MADQIWFRKRRRHEGTGYGVAAPQGVIVAILFVVVATTCTVVPSLIFGVVWWSIGLSIALVIACVAFLYATIRRHSDWQG